MEFSLNGYVRKQCPYILSFVHCRKRPLHSTVSFSLICLFLRSAPFSALSLDSKGAENGCRLREKTCVGVLAYASRGFSRKALHSFAQGKRLRFPTLPAPRAQSANHSCVLRRFQRPTYFLRLSITLCALPSDLGRLPGSRRTMGAEMPRTSSTPLRMRRWIFSRSRTVSVT